jgi:hypothetical protein
MGADDNTANRFLSLGKKYVEEIQQLDREDRLEVSRRFPTNLPPELEAALKTAKGAPKQRREPTASERALAAARAPALSLRETLEQDGSMTRFEAKRVAILDAHLRMLVGLLGTRGYSRLEHWIEMEVRDNVRLARRGTRVSIPDALKNRAAP